MEVAIGNSRRKPQKKPGKYTILKNLSEKYDVSIYIVSIESNTSISRTQRKPPARKRIMSRAENLKRLFNVMLEIYTNRKDSHPAVAAQFHVEGFVSQHKQDAYFDSLLEMEIEDCSRSLVIA